MTDSHDRGHERGPTGSGSRSRSFRCRVGRAGRAGQAGELECHEGSMLLVNVCISDPIADSAAAARFDTDMAIIERLAAGDLDFLCNIIGADSPAELLRKVYRLAAATANPSHALGRMLAGPKEDFATLSPESVRVSAIHG